MIELRGVSKTVQSGDHPLTILQGQIAALTIPTWAPMFAFNIGDNNTWRGNIYRTANPPCTTIGGTQV